MSFLNPALLLWGLPLVLIPVVIHLLNRLRYRSVPWAAMMFLVMANRSSTRNARLRQFLVLLCRMLVILGLLAGLSRPLIGGWVGLALGDRVDTVVVLLDRSASMETVDPLTRRSKRERLLDIVINALDGEQASATAVLIENVLLQPHQVEDAAALAALPLTAATDTAANIPALVEAALDYIEENQTGTTEIWIASDLQRADWRPDSPRWEDLQSRVAGLSQDIRVRVLNIESSDRENLSMTLTGLLRYRRLGDAELDLAIDVSAPTVVNESFPIAIELDGNPSQLDVRLDGQRLALHHRLALGDRTAGGWGRISLPADANSRDNVCYFAYAGAQHLKTAVIAADPATARFLELAAAPAPAPMNVSASTCTPDAVAAVDWAGSAMVIWQAPFAAGAAQAELTAFVRSGGVVVCFPPTAGDGTLLDRISWGAVEDAPAERPFNISHWEQDSGPLARTLTGGQLPVDELRLRRRRQLIAEGEVLATYGDGVPAVVSVREGRGRLVLWTSLPHRDWSNLGEGSVLVPSLQRLLLAGGQRLDNVVFEVCGEHAAADADRPWAAADGSSRDVRWQAGVYRAGDLTLVVNRPPTEDLPDRLDEAGLVTVFGDLTWRMFSETQGHGEQRQSELWRHVLLLVLLLLLGELLLTRPTPRRQEDAGGAQLVGVGA
jgi:hypothetical protein